MKSEKIKIINNANKIIEVTLSAWEILYKDREGFSLFTDEKIPKVEEEKPAVKKTTKKNTPKKVKKND